MKRTLLEIVQEILNDMDSDEVNSIDDTIEAQQVASIVRATFFEIINRRLWPHTYRLFQLESSGDLSLPNYLKLPVRLQELKEIRYDKSKLDSTSSLYEKIRYIYPDEFLRYTSGRKSDDPKVTVVTDPNGPELKIFNSIAPQYWTSFDDQYIVCDSFDKSVDDTLKKIKTQCLAYIIPEWEHNNDAVPDLPDEAFTNLIEEAKSVAFYELKQMTNEKAEQKATRHSRWLARKAWRAHGGVRYPNYGRKC